jgi:hypothetical protein
MGHLHVSHNTLQHLRTMTLLLLTALERVAVLGQHQLLPTSFSQEKEHLNVSDVILSCAGIVASKWMAMSRVFAVWLAIH